MQETHSNPRGNDFLIMDKIPGTMDDCAYAVNLACSTIWHTSGKYPNLAPQIKEESLDELVGDDEELTRVKNRLDKLKLKPKMVK